MRILHVVRGLQNSSGTTQIVNRLTEHQARLGCSVSVAFVAQGQGAPVTPDPALVETCCFEQSLPFYHPGISLGFARDMGRRMPQMDVVHIHAIWNFPTWYAMRTANAAGIPYLVAPQGSLDPWVMAKARMHKRTYARLVELPLMSRAAAVQALTENEAGQIRRHGVGAPIVIVPNGVDADGFRSPAQPLGAQLGLASGTRALLSLSRLNAKKGIDLLISGFARVAERHPEWMLIIAGSDSGSGYRAVLEAVAASTGMAGRVRFIGEVRGSQKRNVLCGADAFALISHSEGLPVACLEAMAAGLPVVITRSCNIPEVAVAEAGLVVDAQTDHVAAALARLFASPDGARVLGANARRLVEQRFTWDRIARSTIDIYREAVSVSARAGRAIV
jgi:glycosyltransferase involved in cell wall biosynthesis